MSELNVNQKTILELLSNKKADFLIPDYQRSYAWEEEHCLTLWDDIYQFSLPDGNYEGFDDNAEYFLGSIVMYRNEKEKLEVIDGQQRLTTLMLILRAFYDKSAKMEDDKSKSTRGLIEKCIWKTDAFDKADKSTLKIDSEVVTDNDKEEFIELLRTGVVKPDSKSQYVVNYKFFQEKIEKFVHDKPSFFPHLPVRILKNCILLPIEAKSQDTALRIFSTLNDRGLQLSDADIFKAQFYKYYDGLDKKDEFIDKWKELEEISNSVWDQKTDNPMDELFTRYMYFLRSKEGNKNTTTERLRKFYERKEYQYLKKENTIEDLKALALFWKDVSEDQFSDDILKKLFVLDNAPNGMWQNITSVYFLHNRSPSGGLEEAKFGKFLDKITAFIFAYAVTNPGFNALRTPIFDEMICIINGADVAFSKYKFSESKARLFFENYVFTKKRKVTRSMITWYAYSFPEQQLLDSKENFHIEHIYAKNRQKMEGGLQDESSLELLGNKVLLERSFNINASDYRFADKKKIYSGERCGRKNKGSKVAEITNRIVHYKEFDEQQIIDRNKAILDKFFDFLHRENLIATKD